MQIAVQLVQPEFDESSTRGTIAVHSMRKLTSHGETSEVIAQVIMRNQAREVRSRGAAKALQFGVGVRVDLAVEADFFESRCRPSHDSPTGPTMGRECGSSIAEPRLQINAPIQK
jgi:hypothetical protein